jgi:ribosomal protein S2
MKEVDHNINVYSKKSFEKKTNYSQGIKVIIKAGVHLGHYESHPGIFPYLYGNRNNRRIFNLKITFKMLY